MLQKDKEKFKNGSHQGYEGLQQHATTGVYKPSCLRLHKLKRMTKSFVCLSTSGSVVSLLFKD